MLVWHNRRSFGCGDVGWLPRRLRWFNRKRFVSPGCLRCRDRRLDVDTSRWRLWRRRSLRLGLLPGKDHRRCSCGWGIAHGFQELGLDRFRALPLLGRVRGKVAKLAVLRPQDGDQRHPGFPLFVAPLLVLVSLVARIVEARGARLLVSTGNQNDRDKRGVLNEAAQRGQNFVEAGLRLILLAFEKGEHAPCNVLLRLG